MVLTFVVYYRIHLNLNLEASARQWPNNLSHPFWENPALKPHALLRFLSGWGFSLVCEHERLLPLEKPGRQTTTVSASAPFPNNSTDFEGSRAFLPRKRLTHSGANGFKPEIVPLSLRDTGYSPSDHKVSLPVHKATLTDTLTRMALALKFQGVKTETASCSQI